LLQIRKNVELQTLATFAVEAKANDFVQLNSVEDIQAAIPEINKYQQKLILGGGSNILFVGDYQGLVIFPQLFGIELIDENESCVRVSVGASENWHHWVCQSNEKGWYGLENLALIPGTVGASPVQNIGAYGVEVKQLIHQVEYIDLVSGDKLIANNHDCAFDYRDSMFKRVGQGRYLVTRVEFNLAKKAELNLSYKPLASYFAGKQVITPKDVLNRVCEIRLEKLPDPNKLANAGSFFKNPVVTQEHYQRLLKEYPDIVAYPVDKKYKLAAGWLIEKAGYKGKRVFNIGVHKAQALVLVNYGESDGNKIWLLAQEIQKVILDKFAVELEAEVRIEGCQLKPNIEQQA
jgi:UDP-N-acetylmuramate dehydrogenase